MTIITKLALPSGWWLIRVLTLRDSSFFHFVSKCCPKDFFSTLLVYSICRKYTRGWSIDFVVFFSDSVGMSPRGGPGIPRPGAGVRGHRTPRPMKRPIDPAVAAKWAAYERVKESICWVMYPNRQGWTRRQSLRLSIAHLDTGSFIELRRYYTNLNGEAWPTRRGVMMRIEEATKILPDLIELVRRMEREGTRQPEGTRDEVELHYPYAPTTPS